jgi:hypothetical protein
LSAAPARLLPWSAAARVIALLVGAGAALPACSPLVRPPNFVGARDQVTDASLIGPFDGQVVDAATAEPIAEATVVAVWSYDRGDGFIGPYGAETYSTVTDATGRYRVPPSRLGVRGSTVRLVDAQVIVYKRGYHGYRSDAVPGGGPRSDFTVRHNKVELRKWLESDSHAEHLMFLSAPRPLQKAVRWEAEFANLDLYRTLGGAGGTAEVPEAGAGDKPQAPVAADLLDASGLLTTEEVRQRTGYADAFDLKDLTDLKRTDFYHGVHMQASTRDERYDVALRVWRAPPGGMDPVGCTGSRSSTARPRSACCCRAATCSAATSTPRSSSPSTSTATSTGSRRSPPAPRPPPRPRSSPPAPPASPAAPSRPAAR